MDAIIVIVIIVPSIREDQFLLPFFLFFVGLGKVISVMESSSSSFSSVVNEDGDANEITELMLIFFSERKEKSACVRRKKNLELMRPSL